MGARAPGANTCPCGSGKELAACCGRFISGRDLPATAEQLMRSRYTAYVLGDRAYLAQTWHPDHFDPALSIEPDTKWLGLDVKQHAQQDADHATVEFVARYRLGGRGHRLHELSRFVREGGRWLYLDGVDQGKSDR